MFAYSFFFITAIFYIGLGLFTASKPTLVGDSAMGYGLGLAFLGVGFAISSLVLTISVHAKGGFDWVGQETGIRTTLVILSWLLVVLATFFCAAFKWEWHTDTVYPQFLHWLAVHYGQLWIPLLWLTACFFSLNAGLQLTVSPHAFTIPFWVGLGSSAVFCTGLLVGYFRDTLKTVETEVASQNRQQDEWHQKNLETIAAHKPEDPIFNLLSYSTQYRPEDIKRAALAKIKAKPKWEAELLELLTNKNTYQEVYYFLDGNRVEHPEQFAEPLNQSILWLSATIKDDIEDSNNLQHWSFDMYGIDRLLRAIDDQFLDQRVDFYPNVVRLKQALDTPPPERFKGVRFSITGVVNTWLKEHKKIN
ncbi:hypothetical protein GCM10028808_31070 [Spirosoma migulaei]